MNAKKRIEAGLALIYGRMLLKKNMPTIALAPVPAELAQDLAELSRAFNLKGWL